MTALAKRVTTLASQWKQPLRVCCKELLRMSLCIPSVWMSLLLVGRGLGRNPGSWWLLCTCHVNINASCGKACCPLYPFWAESSSTTWLIQSPLPFSKPSKGWCCVGQMWKSWRQNKENAQAAIRLLFFWVNSGFGSLISRWKTPWMYKQSPEPSNSLLMGMFTFQNSKWSWFWRLTNILCWMAPLLFFSPSHDAYFEANSAK